ncbi:MAG TPA: hypothetical protein VGS41_00685 [Chthonomonadales bacterium]|nr:hypothetical protein [Chthonomonadales bacterium]
MPPIPGFSRLRAAKVGGCFIAAAAILTISSVRPVLGQTGPVTLRYKFHPGDITKYTLNMSMHMNLGPQSAIATTISADQSQKVIKVLPNGNGVIQTITTNAKTLINGQPSASTMNVPVLTSTLDPYGHSISIKGLPQTNNFTPMVGGGMGANGLAGFATGLPKRPIRVGQSWNSHVKMPAGMGGATVTASARSTLIRFEKVGRYRTARIRTIVNVPIHVNVGAQGKPQATGAGALAVTTGSGTFTVDTNFAIAEGMMIRTSGSGAMTMRLHLNPQLETSQQSNPFAEGPIHITMSMSMTMVQ